MASAVTGISYSAIIRPMEHKSMDSSSLQFNLPPISVDTTEIRKQTTKRSHTFDKKILRVLSIISVPHQKYPKSFSCIRDFLGLSSTTHNTQQDTAHSTRTVKKKKQKTGKLDSETSVQSE